MSADLHDCWIFRLSVAEADRSAADDEFAEALVDAVIDWVDKRGLQIGGSPFEFALERSDGAGVSRQSGEALLQMIKRWAGARGVRLHDRIEIEDGEGRRSR